MLENFFSTVARLRDKLRGALVGWQYGYKALSTCSVTGFMDRRFYDIAGRQAITSHIRQHEHSVAIVYFDLDQFKSVNDMLGHNCGDVVLKFFSYVVQRHLRRDTDKQVRMGGDEFAVFLPGATMAWAETFARTVELIFSSVVACGDFLNLLEELHPATAEIPPEIALNTMSRVGASHGVVYWEDGRGITLDQAIAIADQRMYESKARKKRV